MDGKNGLVLCSSVVATALAAYLSMPLPVHAGPGNGNGNGGGGGGRLSPASLDLDTCGCPTTFGDPICELRTEWHLDKSVASYDPLTGAYAFDVSVTEGATTRNLAGSGTLVVSNSGDQTTSLFNVAASLEQEWDGSPNQNPAPAPGPSGRSWQVLRMSTQVQEPNGCGGTARTCYGDLLPDGLSSLVIYDENGDALANLADIAIPPTVDNDGDGLRDEDPVYTGVNDTALACDIIDNDGDGLYDEDPIDGIDNDGDGAIDEDDPDDDGDGLVDEDGACEDAVHLTFHYNFDITDLDLTEGTALRVDLLGTFVAGGKRGGACELDVNCNGVIDEAPADCDPSQAFCYDERWVRTVQQRLEFAMPACEELCQSVTLTDDGTEADDPDCVMVTDMSNDANDVIEAEADGTEHHYMVSGMAVCLSDPCVTLVTNEACLAGDGCDGLILPEPCDSASFVVECGDGGGGGGGGGFTPGDFCSQTQGGWGTDTCRGSNTACLRDTYFAEVFPDGLVVGMADCNSVTLTSSDAVKELLPTGGTPGSLAATYIDPASTSAGVFLGQLVAASLNVAFDAAGYGKCSLTEDCDFAYEPGTLGTLVYVADCDGVPACVAGLSVNEVLEQANRAISGCPAQGDCSIGDLNTALDLLNNEFVDCDTVESGCLDLP